ncbi:DgyrCDS11537 [Dimorphilus gyrociliatus]|uniref:DgyrCDS11537 n=1 Tax=Dimorphilus gyrociliatus TaxID=2664684 RepID=A0A7I8W5H3_9ANNE|nr:DgyrCDS11537 [Dimorphilus gyrociliatus]
MENKIATIQKELLSNVYRDILDFIGKSGAEKFNDIEVPTIGFVMGTNTSEHESIILNLKKEILKSNTTSFVAAISRNISNTGQFYKDLLECLTEEDDTIVENSDDENTETNKSFMKLSASRATFGSLVKWYEETESKSPVIVVVPDMHNFPSTILEDFVTLSSAYSHQIPVVLILGLSTAITTIHKSLSQSVTSLMSIETYYAPTPCDHLLEIIKRVILNPDFPIKLPYKTFRLMMDDFLSHNFSVKNFELMLKFVVLQHYFCNELSTYCQSLDRVKSKIKSAKKSDLQILIKVKSFQSYLNNLVADERESILKDTIKLKDLISALMEEFYVYQVNFEIGLKCLNAFFSRIPQCSLGRNLRDIYVNCLKTNITQKEEFEDSLKVQLSIILSECISILEGSNLTDALETLDNFLSKVNNSEETAEETDKQEQDENDNELILPEKTSLSALKQTLKKMNEKKQNKKMTLFERLKRDCINFLNEFFSETLKPPRKIVFFEVFYPSNTIEGRFYENVTRDPFSTPKKH